MRIDEVVDGDGVEAAVELIKEEPLAKHEENADGATDGDGDAKKHAPHGRPGFDFEEPQH